MKTECIANRTDLSLEDTSKKVILLIDVACPNKYNKVPNNMKRTINYALNYKNKEKGTEWK